jgi:hypothetical protein
MGEGQAMTNDQHSEMTNDYYGVACGRAFCSYCTRP